MPRHLELAAYTKALEDVEDGATRGPFLEGVTQIRVPKVKISKMVQLRSTTGVLPCDFPNVIH